MSLPILIVEIDVLTRRFFICVFLDISEQSEGRNYYGISVTQ